jgi:hypothetical protein
VFPVGIGLRDPRSQKRDLGHPSVFTLRYCRGDQGKVNVFMNSGCRTEVFRRLCAFRVLGGVATRSIRSKESNSTYCHSLITEL